MCIRDSAGTGFMHESFHKDDPKKFTRSWFAWANTLFGELLWKTFNEKPYLLAVSYTHLHILDMSWTALLMLRWYDELEKDARLLAYAEDYDVCNADITGNNRNEMIRFQFADCTIIRPYADADLIEMCIRDSRWFPLPALPSGRQTDR